MLGMLGLIGLSIFGASFIFDTESDTDSQAGSNSDAIDKTVLEDAEDPLQLLDAEIADAVSDNDSVDTATLLPDRSNDISVPTIVGYEGDDTAQGLAGADFLSGNEGTDYLDGNDGDDKIYGGRDNDTLRGGAGNDLLSGGNGTDTLFGDDGNDYLNGDAGNDTLNGGTGEDALRGGDGNDQLNGGNGSDFLFGGDGNDTLVGGHGDDTLLVQSNDTATGGAGEDTFILGTNNAQHGASDISDFDKSEDSIVLVYDDAIGNAPNVDIVTNTETGISTLYANGTAISTIHSDDELDLNDVVLVPESMATAEMLPTLN